MPLPIDDLDEILQEIYPRQRLCNSLTVKQAHRLGVLCMVFLLGTFMDIKKDSAAAAASDAEIFHQLARAALTIDPLTEHLTISGVQALVCQTTNLTSALVDNHCLGAHDLVLSTISSRQKVRIPHHDSEFMWLS